MIKLVDDEPKWTQIADILAARIHDGVYQPGDRIPTVMEIVGEFSVANRTAQKALAELRRRDLIKTVSGMGSFVKKTAEAPES